MGDATFTDINYMAVGERISIRRARMTGRIYATLIDCDGVAFVGVGDTVSEALVALNDECTLSNRIAWDVWHDDGKRLEFVSQAIAPTAKAAAERVVADEDAQHGEDVARQQITWIVRVARAGADPQSGVAFEVSGGKKAIYRAEDYRAEEETEEEDCDG